MATIQRVRDRGTERARRIIADFGRDLRDGRRLSGLSQLAVAKAAGISRSHLSRIERGLVPNLSIDVAARLAASVGLDLSVRTYPGGTRIRDIGQVRLLLRFRAIVAPSFAWRTEVTVGPIGDSRAWDGTLAVDDRQAGVEAVVHIHDWQALDRQISIRRRDIGVDVVILVLADTRHNRAVLRAIGLDLAVNFPGTIRDTIASLRAGVLPGESAIVLI